MDSKSEVIEISKSINSKPKPPPPPPLPKESAKKGRPPKEPKDQKDPESKDEIDENAEETERRDNIRKINKYVKSPVFKRVCEELGLKPFRGNESLEVTRETLRQIRDRNSDALKRILINKAFEKGVFGVEYLALTFLKDQDFEGFGQSVAGSREYFEEELEEIAIEMGDLPHAPAWVRLIGKVVYAAGEYRDAKKKKRLSAGKEESKPSTPTGKK